jgi:hypothetical protein
VELGDFFPPLATRTAQRTYASTALAKAAPGVEACRYRRTVPSGPRASGPASITALTRRATTAVSAITPDVPAEGESPLE